MLKLAVFVLAALLSVEAQRESFYFPPETLLTCYAPDGQELSPPYIQLEPGYPYRPVTSGFTSPLRGPMTHLQQEILRDFLGPECLNEKLTFIGETFPDTHPVLPSDHLPLPYPPVSSGDLPGGVGTIFRPSEIDTNYTETRLRRWRIEEPTRTLVVETTVRLEETCNVVAQWVRLPEGQFFPQWVSASVCDGGNLTSCSLPPGMTCQPLLMEETLVMMTVLRWDCCWNVVHYQWRWECGWRKTYIPFITQCRCACFPIRYPYDIYPHDTRDPYDTTGRIGGTFNVIYTTDLNT